MNKKIMSAVNPDLGELVLKIGTEGGSLNIHRHRLPDGSCKFVLVVDESIMAELLPGQDQMDLVKKIPPVDTFEEAIHLMNKYPWHEMVLVSVHPEYAEYVRSEKEERSTLKRRKFMHAQGPLTTAVAGAITKEMNERGYDVYSDHDQAGKFVGTIAVSIGEKLSREKEISQLDIAVIKRNSNNKVIALVEIEETTDNPKKLIGDIWAVLMGNSTWLPGGGKMSVGPWTSLIIIGKGEGHDYRNRRIQEMANKARSAWGTVNSRIGNVVIRSFAENDDLKKVLMRQINRAI